MLPIATRKPHFIDRWPMPLSEFNIGFTVANGAIANPEKRRKRVCIYGAGMGRNEAPLNDPEWEVWALNLVPPQDMHNRLRADRWFDIHQRCAQTPDDLKWIAACPMPIYVPPDLLNGSKNSVRFPLQEIEDRFGGYWSCTFAYQLALIMFEDVATDIGLYGVELALGTLRERTVEWACTSYWMGRAEERGFRFHLPRQSMLGRHPARYGFAYQREIDIVKDYTDRYREFMDLQHDVAGTVEEG